MEYVFYLFYILEVNLPLIISLSVLVFLLILCCAICIGVKLSKKGLKIDEPFILELMNAYGGKENIREVFVDNGRLKITVEDLDKTDLEKLKSISTSGVFVTGNTIKTLFKLDSETIKSAIEKKL